MNTKMCKNTKIFDVAKQRHAKVGALKSIQEKIVSLRLKTKTYG